MKGWNKFDNCTKKLMSEMQIKKKQHLCPTCYLLDYLVACYGIFTERLINSRYSLKKDNINEEEKNRIDYGIFL